MKNCIPVVCLAILLVSSGIGTTVVSAGSEPVNLSVQSDEPYRIGNGYISGDGEVRMNGLINLLQDIGLDISYGDGNGTVFSMVDQSLTRIISDLSSGNTDGFMDIPLIKEILKYLGINPDSFIVHPEDVTSSMEAIDRYNQKYPADRNNTL